MSEKVSQSRTSSGKSTDLSKLTLSAKEPWLWFPQATVLQWLLLGTRKMSIIEPNKTKTLAKKI